jgi:hypothetical protein
MRGLRRFAPAINESNIPMRGKPINLPELSKEEQLDQEQIFREVYLRQEQTDALRRRRAEPMADYLLREILLRKLKQGFKP